MLMNSKKWTILTALAILILLFVRCENTLEASFAEKIETAHHKIEFQREKAIEFDILLVFGNKTRLLGKMTLLTDGTKGLIEEKNGDQLYFDHDDIYLDSNLTSLEGARFKAYTWSYFFLFPYKLTDPGTVWNPYSDSILDGKTYDTGKLTFESGAGDADQDWYIVYADQETNLVHAAAYIVTANKSKEEAEKDPHAILYADYKQVNGVPIAQKWSFYEWTEKDGLTNKLGQADLTGIRFVEVDSTFFNPPVGFERF